MKRILITAGSHSEIPLIRAAKEMGYYVISTGTDKDGLGHKESDEYIHGDFSDKEFVYTIAKTNNIEAIVSGCNDFAYLSAAYACERLGLPGHDTYSNAEIIHHKDKFRSLTQSLGIKTPQVFKCASKAETRKIADKVTFPVLVKPVDLTGGKGVCVCNSSEELLNSFNVAMSVTRKPYVIIEEYVTGTNHGASVLLKDKKVVFYVFDDEQYFQNKYLVQGASIPSDTVSEAGIFTLMCDIEKVAQKLSLVDGLFHVQFIVDKTGYPVMIDPCRRAPGDLYILLAKYTTGVDYPKEIVKAECGLALNNVYSQSHNFVSRQCIMSEKNGIIKTISISDSLNRYIKQQMLWGKTGDEVSDFMKYKAGILFLQFPDFTTMQDILADFHQLVKIEIK